MRDLLPRAARDLCGNARHSYASYQQPLALSRWDEGEWSPDRVKGLNKRPVLRPRLGGGI
jgi:hypothetical protein